MPKQRTMVLRILRIFGHLILCLIQVFGLKIPLRFTTVFNRYLNEYCCESLNELCYSNLALYPHTPTQPLHLEMLLLKNVYTVRLICFYFEHNLQLNQLFPNLHSLYLYNVSPYLIQVNIPTMKHLYFESNQHKGLEIDWCSRSLYAMDEHATIFELNPQLESLQIYVLTPSNFSADLFRRVNQHLKNLKFFGFYTGSSDFSLDGEIHFNTVETFEIDAYGFFCFRFPKLKELRVIGGSAINYGNELNELDFFAQLENITTMKIQGPRGRFKKILQLDNLLQNLVELRIDMIDAEFFEDLMSFCSQSKSLKTFVILFRDAKATILNYRLKSYDPEAQPLVKVSESTTVRKHYNCTMKFTIKSSVGRPPMNCIMIMSKKFRPKLMDLSTWKTDWNHIRCKFIPFKSNGCRRHESLWLAEHECVHYWRSMCECPNPDLSSNYTF